MHIGRLCENKISSRFLEERQEDLVQRSNLRCKMRQTSGFRTCLSHHVSCVLSYIRMYMTSVYRVCVCVCVSSPTASLTIALTPEHSKQCLKFEFCWALVNYQCCCPFLGVIQLHEKKGRTPLAVVTQPARMNKMYRIKWGELQDGFSYGVVLASQLG